MPASVTATTPNPVEGGRALRSFGVVDTPSAPRLVLIRDPRGEHWEFKRPVFAKQVAEGRLGGVVLTVICELLGGTRMSCPPDWVTPMPDVFMLPLDPAGRPC